MENNITEDGFADDELTFLILQDATLWANSIELEAFSSVLVYETRDRLVAESYVIISATGPISPKTGERRQEATLTGKGGDLFSRLKRKLKKT